jgi:hypothetical protein
MLLVEALTGRFQVDFRYVTIFMFQTRTQAKTGSVMTVSHTRGSLCALEIISLVLKVSLQNMSRAKVMKIEDSSTKARRK